MVEGSATKTAEDPSKLSREHWFGIQSLNNQSSRFFSICPLQFRPLLVHHQVKAGSISGKLISIKELVFLQKKEKGEKTHQWLISITEFVFLQLVAPTPAGMLRLGIL